MAIAQFLLTFREGLEAALIVSILAAYLARIGRRDLNRLMYAGSLAAVGLSVALGIAVLLTVREIGSPWEETFEGIAALTAVVVLTYMIFWMGRHAREIRGELQRKVDATISRGRMVGIAGLAFIAVFREGVETVLFLTPLGASDPLGTGIGLLVGLAAVSLLAVAMFRGSARLDLRRFFTVTSILLIVFAAGLTAIGVHELNEVYALTSWGVPAVVEPIWDTTWILDERSVAGLILKSLVGYNANPSLTEVLAYVGYWAVVGGTAMRTFGPGQFRAILQRFRAVLAGRPQGKETVPENGRTMAR